MLSTKKILGLITLFIGLTFVMFNISAGHELADINPKTKIVKLSGTVVDASTRQPVSGASVKVPVAGKETQTDDQGTFNFEDLNPGTYNLQVDHSDYKSYSKSVEINNQDKELTIRLESN